MPRQRIKGNNDGRKNCLQKHCKCGDALFKDKYFLHAVQGPDKFLDTVKLLQ